MVMLRCHQLPKPTLGAYMLSGRAAATAVMNSRENILNLTEKKIKVNSKYQCRIIKSVKQ
jgi:hypothetical protein